MLKTRICAFLLAGFGAVPVAACNEGHQKTPSPSFEATSWNELASSGVEISLDSANASPSRSWGVARLDGSSRELRGKVAFDAVRGRAGNDPTVLATLSMLFLDDGVSNLKPWTKVDGTRSAEQQAVAKPPAVSGDTLTYWRFHERLADMVRCQLQLSSGQITCQLGGDVVQSERIAGDPAAAAKQYLASPEAGDHLRGIEALGRVKDDHAREQLIDFALNAYNPQERRAAVQVLGTTGGTGVVAALSRVLLYDKDSNVRGAAAAALGKLRDPAGRDALERADKGDSDARVQVVAGEALKQLK